MEVENQNKKNCYAVIQIIDNGNKLVNKQFEIMKNRQILKLLRDLIIYCLYLEKLREGEPSMQIYTNVENYIKEIFDFKLSEERIRKICKKLK